MIRIEIAENTRTGNANIMLINENESSKKAVSLTTIDQNIVVLSLSDVAKLICEMDDKSSELNSLLERKIGMSFSLKVVGRKTKKPAKDVDDVAGALGNV